MSLSPRDGAVQETEPAVCLPCTSVNSAHRLWCLQDSNPRTSNTYSSPAGTRDEGDSQIRRGGGGGGGGWGRERETETGSTPLSALLITFVAVKLKHLDLVSELGVPSLHRHL